MRQVMNVKKLQKGSRCLTVRQEAPGCLTVSSSSGNGDYSVVLAGQNGHRRWICDCRWGQGGGMMCRHRMAAMNYLAETKMGRRLSFWLAEEDALRQHLPMVRRNGLWVTMRLVR